MRVTRIDSFVGAVQIALGLAACVFSLPYHPDLHNRWNMGPEALLTYLPPVLWLLSGGALVARRAWGLAAGIIGAAVILSIFIAEARDLAPDYYYRDAGEVAVVGAALSAVQLLYLGPRLIWGRPSPAR